MPRVVAVVVSSVVVGPFLASALSASPPHHATRRAAVSSSLSSFVLSLATLTAAAKEEDDAQEMYFGVGCFWHVQHEFAALEKSLLGRKDPTATAGYAGGLATGRDASRPGKDLVCYHNFQRLADYGKLGHAEVVGVQVPSKHVAAFADQYVALFVRGDRPDKLDVGPEYRSLLGLPGGVDAPSFQDTIGPKLRDAGLEPRRGTGNDPDTLGKKNRLGLRHRVLPRAPSGGLPPVPRRLLPGGKLPRRLQRTQPRRLPKRPTSGYGLPGYHLTYLP
mmetsp:Transcript_32753/g.104395  ORF Transcript_32753/g.104395 Transcript_32753/m.104395 type:complete len:276 (-) Transcript_32753:132-959(-)